MRFFALYRERAGASERGWELPESATLADLLREIRDAYPGLAPPEVEIVAAVNEEYAEGGTVLSEGDEVALIPPVSGGFLSLAQSDISLRSVVEGRGVNLKGPK